MKDQTMIVTQNMALAVNLFNIIRNKTELVSIDKVIKIADALNVSLDDLVK